jgi:DNA polymerase alpha subunit B
MDENNDLKLTELFASGASASLDPSILGELNSICRLHSLTPQECFYKWESYSMKMGSENTVLTLETVRAFKQDIQDALANEMRSKAHTRGSDRKPKISSTPRSVKTPGDVFGM